MKKFDLLKVSFIVRSDKKQSGVSPVLMMLSIDGRRAYISTGHKVQVSDWDSSNGKFIGGSAKIRTLNEFLDRMKYDVIRIYNELKSKDDDITVDILRSRLKGSEVKREKSLIEVCEIYNTNMEKLVGIEIEKDTFRRYGAFKTKLADFIQSKFKSKDILLSSLKYSFAIEYEQYLKTEVKLHQNTLVKYMQYLIRVVDFAVKYEWVEKNVLFGHKCPVKETKREYLTADELQRIMDKEIRVVRLQEVRDCFVFCCYTGYAYKDAANLTPDHIGTGINGSKWIYTSRQKNDNVSNVPLLDQAMEIIEKYADHPDCVSKNKLLPMKSNQKLNAYLKELADICEITKPMTMHIARHTFATTVLLSNGVSMEATSKMLGHSSLKTTQIYGKILETRVGSEMEMLKAKLSTSKKSDQKREAK
jgi:site-specific recombinase XerD